RDDQYFRKSLETMLPAHVLLEHAEAPGEGDLVFGSELLVAEEHDLVLEEGLGDARESVVVQRRREVDAANFGAQVGAPPGHREFSTIQSLGCCRRCAHGGLQKFRGADRRGLSSCCKRIILNAVIRFLYDSCDDLEAAAHSAGGGASGAQPLECCCCPPHLA